jgi:hypothetical protein
MTKTKTTKQLADAILAPLIKHCSTHQGARKEVAELFNKGLSSKVRITTINKWIQSDEKKRIEPAGGSLLRLLECWRDIRQPDVVNWQDQTIECAANGCVPSRTGNCRRCGRTF